MAEPVATLPARFHLSGHCDNAAHSACPNPDKCTCECHVSAPEAGGESVYDAETDAAFDEFLRSDPSAQEAMRQQWAKRTKKSMNDQSGPKTCERIYADMETGDWFPERVGERPMNLVEYTRAAQPSSTPADEEVAREIVDAVNREFDVTPSGDDSCWSTFLDRGVVKFRA